MDGQRVAGLVDLCAAFAELGAQRLDPLAFLDAQAAEIETYNDHRVAMCFGMLGLRVPGIRLRNPACVRKTFPNFFVKLAGLGAGIRDAGTGRTLAGDDLLA